MYLHRSVPLLEGPGHSEQEREVAVVELRRRGRPGALYSRHKKHTHRQYNSLSLSQRQTDTDRQTDTHRQTHRHRHTDTDTHARTNAHT